jgi:integrase
MTRSSRTRSDIIYSNKIFALPAGVTRTCESCRHRWYIHKRIKRTRCLDCFSEQRRNKRTTPGNNGSFRPRSPHVHHLDTLPFCPYNNSVRAGMAEMADAADLKLSFPSELVSKFLKSRRQGLSPKTLKFYKGYLRHSIYVIGLNINAQDIEQFLDSLQCTNGGKHAYFRTLKTFYFWLYSKKSGYKLSPQDNPISLVDSPKVGKRILPSLTETQVSKLLNSSDNLRDRCIISLLADSGMRLSELTSIRPFDIDWGNYTITIIGKGNKQRKAPFTDRTANLLKLYLNNNGHHQGNIWGMNDRAIQWMLSNLEKQTGIKSNPHSFRRGFACNLHRKGLSTLDIMHLGGWSDLSMVLRYTRSITFEDCLEHYRQISVK